MQRECDWCGNSTTSTPTGPPAKPFASRSARTTSANEPTGDSSAERLSSPSTADSSRAPLAREWSRLYEDLVREVPDEDDPLPALRLRYLATRAAAGPAPERCRR